MHVVHVYRTAGAETLTPRLLVSVAAAVGHHMMTPRLMTPQIIVIITILAIAGIIWILIATIATNAAQVPLLQILINI